MCNSCQNIFCKHCIDSCRDKKCPTCSQVFVACKQTRQLRKILGSLQIKCKNSACKKIFAYNDVKNHLHNIVLTTCPFNCSNFRQCEVSKLRDHVLNECTGKELKCPDQECDINVYREYAG